MLSTNIFNGDSMSSENLENKTLDAIWSLVLNSALIKLDAKSGSIMVVNKSHSEDGVDFLSIKARLGLPKENRVEEPIYTFNGKSNAAWVALNKKSNYIKNTEVEEEHFEESSRINAERIKSIVSIPILNPVTDEVTKEVTNEVVAVFNADSFEEDAFNSDKIKEVEEYFKRDVAKHIVDRISLLDACADISECIVEHTDNVKGLPLTIAEKIQKALACTSVIIYEYDNDSKKFIIGSKGPARAGVFKEEKYMKDQMHPTDVPYGAVDHKKPRFIDNVERARDLTERNRKEQKRPRFTVREGISSVAIIPLWVNGTDRCVGVMFINYIKPHHFNDDEKNAVMTFARNVAVVLYKTQNEIHKTLLYGKLRTDYGRTLITSRDFQKYFSKKTCKSFVFTIDIRRSTELMNLAVSSADYVEFISELNKTIREIILHNCGIVDKFTGDGIIAYFTDFYAGTYAGILAIEAAIQCHNAFNTIYEKHLGLFKSPLVRGADGVGFGIGIDYGDIYLDLRDMELFAVGEPIVKACRLASAGAGETLLNQSAYNEVKDKDFLSLTRIEFTLKHEGRIYAYKVKMMEKVDESKIPKLEDILRRS